LSSTPRAGLGDTRPGLRAPVLRASGLRGRRALRRWAGICTIFGAIAVATTFAVADQRSEYLIRVLDTSPMPRVRTQAAISLGGVSAETEVITALSNALREDTAASVRAAAANSLGQLGDPSALSALRRAAQSDSDTGVRNAASAAVTRLSRSGPRVQPIPNAGNTQPSGNVRYYVAVGRPGTKISGISPQVLDSARDFIAREAGNMSGVEIAPNNQSNAQAGRVLSQRNLTGYYIDTSITTLESSGGGVRARVSVVLQTYPGRNIRSMLTGGATVTGGGSAGAERQAIEAALRAALRNLPQAMQASASAQARGP
jgi:hypothetical protein